VDAARAGNLASSAGLEGTFPSVEKYQRWVGKISSCRHPVINMPSQVGEGSGVALPLDWSSLYWKPSPHRRSAVGVPAAFYRLAFFPLCG
jgi:hypothetical protein